MKRTLRRLVLQTSGSPLVHAYRAAYRLLIRAATAAFARHPEVSAVYLGRSCASDRITPGISDIDFVVVLEGDGARRGPVEATWRALRRMSSGVIEFYPGMLMSESWLARRWRTVPVWQYRLLEGRSQWKLVHGRDVLAGLPPLDAQQIRTAAYVELGRWWLLFAIALGRPHDPIMDNVICHKAVGEVLDVHHALRHGVLRSSRSAALAGDDSPLARRLEEVAKQRFLVARPGLVDETLRFLLGFFVDLWRGFPTDPFLRVVPDRPQEVDCPAAELELPLEVAALERHLAVSWKDRCRGTHVVKSAFWDFDDLLFLVDLDPAALPSAAEIAELARRSRPGLAIFLRLGSVGFPVAPVLPRDFHRALLTPATTPDVFLQLGEPAVYATDYTDWYLGQWESNERWPDPPARKRAQLEIMAASAARGRIVYPLTAPALERARRRVESAG